jgi:N-acetylneuraminate synthase
MTDFVHYDLPKPTSELLIEGKYIGERHATYFIADVAANHDGDLERAKDLIYMVKEAGADAAKFQHFRAENIVSDVGFESLGVQQSHQASWKKSVVDAYRDASVSKDWTETLKATCEKAGLTFFTSPYDFDLVEHIDPFVPAYKIGSGDITWIEMVELIASKQKPYILATGASTTDDVIRAVSAGLTINPKMALLQCNTNYTGDLENLRYVQLNVLKTYRLMFPEMILGLSDHTPGHATVLGAVTLGARIIEKHFTDDTDRIGPDHKFSMDPKSWREMVDRTRELEAALGNGLKKVELNEQETVVIQRRALRLVRNLPAGHILTKDDLSVLRPAPTDSLLPYEIDKVLGRHLRAAKERGSHLTLFDLA